ncbi:hypothetical protein BGW39_000132, partial [Mortierella sp. 14UC]
MSTAGSTVVETTVTSNAIILPELNELLIPMLWHTIDTRTGRWNEIFRDFDTGSRSRDDIVAWVKTIFLKYGHHILTYGWMQQQHRQYPPTKATTPSTSAAFVMFDPPVLPWVDSD